MPKKYGSEIIEFEIEKHCLFDLLNYLVIQKDDFVSSIDPDKKSINKIIEIILSDNNIKSNYLSWTLDYMLYESYGEKIYYNYPNKKEFLNVFKNYRNIENVSSNRKGWTNETNVATNEVHNIR